MDVRYLLFSFLLLIANLSPFASSSSSSSSEEEEEGTTWAVLVATSSNVYNYDFEAAVYKTYQLLRNGGVPARNIIVFSTDVIAFDKNNPYPGSVFYGTDAVTDDSEDVYIGGENIDYAGVNNTAANFLAVLRGDEKAITTGSGRVLKTNPEDKVLIFYVGYGSTGALFFPKSRDDVYADELIPLLEDLLTDKYFRKLLIVFEVSKGGSNFDGYLTQIDNVMAVSSTGRTDYYRGHMREKSIDQYTVPYFTYNWLHFVEKAQKGELNERDSTVLNQFSNSKNIENGEKFNIYGNLNAACKTKITEFYGKQESTKSDHHHHHHEKQTFANKRYSSVSNAVNYEQRSPRPNGQTVADQYSTTPREKEINGFVDKMMKDIFKNSIDETPINERDVAEETDFILPLDKFKCYRNLISSFRNIFPDTRDKYVPEVHYTKFAKLCSLNIPEEKVIQTMKTEYEQNRHLFSAFK